MNTTENNKIIAEFMGSNYINEPYTDKEGITHDFYYWTKPSCNYPKSIGIGELSTAWQIGNFHFHNDWNWLMQVVEKIENYYTPNYYSQIASEKDYCCSLDIHTDSVCITVHFKQKDPSEKRKYKQFIKNVSASKIEAVYDACLEFINWYNENSAKQN